MTSISNSEDQHCRLCNEHRPLQHSHILPAFVFKWLKKDGFIRHAESINQRAQDGAKAYWLCSSCEALFNGWETRFANEIFHPTNEQGLSTLRYGEWLLKFCASISWRSLLYIRERSSLTEYSQEEIDSVSDAQKTWAEFLRGERDHPGTFEQHLVPFGPIKTNTSIKFPPNINRHLLRNVEIDLARGASTIFVFSKLGRLAVLGFVRLEKPNRWVGSKVRLRGGTIQPRRYVFPIEFGDYLAERASRAWTSFEKMSPSQHQKVEKTIRSNIDRLANSDLLKAIEHDVEMFGDAAFHKRTEP